MRRKIALITGGNGFVGFHLTHRLIKNGWDVHLIIKQGGNIDVFSQVKERITLYNYSGKISEISSVFKNVEPAVVFHLASLFLAEHQSEQIEELINSNILFAIQLAEGMVKNNVNKLINTGTSWQHFESSDYNPVCLYAATKQAAEVMLKYYIEAENLKVINLKLTDTYGPKDTRHKLFPILLKISKEKNILEMSKGEQLIDIVYIDDVVNAYLLAAERLLEGKVKKEESYIVSSGNPIKLKELVKTYQNIAGQKLDIKWGKRPYRKREVMVPWNKGKYLPGWESQVSIKEGIRKILNSD